MFTLSSNYLFVIFTFVLIGRCDYFGFGFTTLNRNALYVRCMLTTTEAPNNRKLYDSFKIKHNLLFKSLFH